MNIKLLRKSRGITQEELSERIGVHENTIRLWEKGLREPRSSDISKLCEVLCCTESELLNGPSDGKVKITLVYDWTHMEGGKIDMNGNDFELILGSNGQIGLKGAGKLTSAEAIEEFLSRVKEQLTIALDAQIKRGVVQG